MKKLDIKQLDEREVEIADALISLGLGRPVARTLAYLNNGDEKTSNELETGTGLRQPEVSIVMRLLKERDWINERDEKKPGKGRPYKIYSLKVGFKDIIAHLERQQRKAAEETQAKIEKLRELEPDFQGFIGYISKSSSSISNFFKISFCSLVKTVSFSISSPPIARVVFRILPISSRPSLTPSQPLEFI